MQTQFPGQPEGTKAKQLPDDGFTKDSYFLSLFGRPEMTSACECERTEEPNLAQSLHLLNSKTVHEKLKDAEGRVARLVGDRDQTDEEKLRRLFLWTYSRDPVSAELKTALSHVEHKRASEDEPDQGTQAAYEDVLWALLNTKEFLFNH